MNHANAPINAQQVSDFLLEHPQFFEQQPSLLKSLRLKESAGNTISLIERQNQLLRDENAELTERLNYLYQLAQQNDQLFIKLQALVLALLSHRDDNSLLLVLKQGLLNHFNVHQVQLVDCTHNGMAGTHWLPISTTRIAEHFPELAHQAKAVCGQFNSTQRQLLFAGEKIKSLAMAPLIKNNNFIGLIALGHESSSHFGNGTQTLFLSYLAKIVSLLIPSHAA